MNPDMSMNKFRHSESIQVPLTSARHTLISPPCSFLPHNHHGLPTPPPSPDGCSVKLTIPTAWSVTSTIYAQELPTNIRLDSLTTQLRNHFARVLKLNIRHPRITYTNHPRTTRIQFNSEETAKQVLLYCHNSAIDLAPPLFRPYVSRHNSHNSNIHFPYLLNLSCHPTEPLSSLLIKPRPKILRNLKPELQTPQALYQFLATQVPKPSVAWISFDLYNGGDASAGSGLVLRHGDSSNCKSIIAGKGRVKEGQGRSNMHRVVAIQFWSKSANKRGEEALRKAGISAHAFFPNVLSCTNLDPELPEEDAVALLQQLFSPYEEIMRVQIFTREDVAEDCTCTGLIELKSLKQAQLAISELDGSSLNGRQITVRFWECQNPVKTQKLAKVDAEKGSSSAVLSTGDDGHTKMSTTEDDLVSNERTPPLALAEKYCSDQYISYPLTPPLSPIDSVNIPSSPSSNCSTSAPPPSPCSENIDPPTLDVTPTLNVGPPRIQFGTVNATRVNVLRALTRGVTQDTPVLFRRLAGRKHNAQIEDQSLKKDYLPVLVKSAILTPDIPEKCTSVGPTTQTSKKTDRSDIKFDYTSQTALIEAKSSRGDEKRQLIATVSVPWRSRDRIQGVGEAKVGPTEVKPMRRWSDDWDEDEGLPPLPVEWLQAYRCEIR